MEIPARDCATALNPSDTLSVTAFPTKMVSADKRLINSPVLVLSKNAVSCFSMELKSFSRSRVIIFCPEITVSQINYYYYYFVQGKTTVEGAALGKQPRNMGWSLIL